MRTRIAGACVALLVASVTSLTLGAQDKSKKMSKPEQQDVSTLVKLVDQVSMGEQPAPAQFSVTWVQSHFLRAQDGRTFMPFTIAVDRSQFSGEDIAMYVRAVAKTPPAAAADTPPRVEYAWDDIQFFDLPADGHVSRALAVAGGEYDLFIALKEGGTGKKNEVKKMAMLRQDLSVPDYAQPASLTTSTVIIADMIEASPSVLGPEEQRSNPYTFGTLRVVPSPTGALQKDSELQLVFWIYGVTAAAAQKPDVVVDYNFHQVLPEGEKYFNKTAPQALNSQTLPPEFDLSVGHLLMGTLAVPLGSFPPGDYRVEVKVTDKPSGKSVTRNVTFSVAA